MTESVQESVQETIPEPGEANIAYEATCKVCKRPVIAEADAHFAHTHSDKLATWLQMVTCMRCYDLMLRRDRAEHKIKVQCEFLIMAKSLDVDVKNAVFNLVKEATKEYAKVIADYHQAEPPPWNDSYARMLMEQPAHWRGTLNSYRAMVRSNMQQPLIEEAPAEPAE